MVCGPKICGPNFSGHLPLPDFPDSKIKFRFHSTSPRDVFLKPPDWFGSFLVKLAVSIYIYSYFLDGLGWYARAKAQEAVDRPASFYVELHRRFHSWELTSSLEIGVPLYHHPVVSDRLGPQFSDLVSQRILVKVRELASLEMQTLYDGVYLCSNHAIKSSCDKCVFSVQYWLQDLPYKYHSNTRQCRPLKDTKWEVVVLKYLLDCNELLHCKRKLRPS